MFRIYSNRNVSQARRERAISVGNRYISNIQATRQYARDRANSPRNVHGEPILNHENVSRMANRQYARSTYMGLKNALGGGNRKSDFIQTCVLENRSSRRIAEIAGFDSRTRNLV